jgi:ABC-2 type transport system ATP-binding protein
MNPILQLNNVWKQFQSSVLAVKDLTLSIERGEIFTLLGANGAGKTTTLNLILNFMPPTKGEIYVDGIDVLSDPVEAKKRMAYVSENVMLYGNLSALENLAFFTKISGKKGLKTDDYVKTLKRVGLPEESLGRHISTFSKGMRQKCGIAIAIQKEASLLLLDEPTSGLDPQSGLEFQKLLVGLRSEGKAILMTSHDIFRAREISDRIGIMRQGELIAVLPRKEFINRDLTDVYVEYMNYDKTVLEGA